jgi:hypothetical protein
MVLGPVLVTVEAPRIVKLSAEPSIVPANASDGLYRNAANGTMKIALAAQV